MDSMVEAYTQWKRLEQGAHDLEGEGEGAHDLEGEGQGAHDLACMEQGAQDPACMYIQRWYSRVLTISYAWSRVLTIPHACKYRGDTAGCSRSRMQEFVRHFEQQLPFDDAGFQREIEEFMEACCPILAAVDGSA